MESSYTLSGLGWDDQFADKFCSLCATDDRVARVAAVDKDQYLLLNESGALRGKLSGKFRHQSHTKEEMPCVGDWLCIEKSAADEFALIHRILPRKTSLQRKAVGPSSDYQMIAANIDVVFIVQSCHYDFNLKRLERYLLMAQQGGADAVIVLSKTDLVSDQELADKIRQIRDAGITLPIQSLSNITRQGVEQLCNLLAPARTYCFVGSSGVGKSTMINALLGESRLATKEVSASGEGTHTTVRRELIMLDNGAMVIDNPGMREFGVVASDQAVYAGFADIQHLAQDCRFRNCTHTSEPGCAVVKALQEGRISAQHFDNFKKLAAESKYNQMSHVEKRKKDRDFGKYVKQVKKDLYRD